MPNVELVIAARSDLPRLMDYLFALREEDPMPASTVADSETTTAAIEALVTDPTLGRVWLIHADGEPVGYAALTFVHSIEFGGRCGFIDELFIDRDSRDRGVGRAALTLIADAAQALRVRVLLLEVSPENRRAAKFYERAGFGERTYRLMVRRV